MSRGDKWLLWSLSLLLVAAALFLCVWAAIPRSPKMAPSCLLEPGDVTLTDGQTVELSELPEVAPQENIQVRDLERDRAPVTLRTFLHLDQPMAEGVNALNVRTGPFQRSDGRTLEAEQLRVAATIDPRGRRDTLEIAVCFDPVVHTNGNKDPLVAEAGSYTGTVYIDDPRVTGGSATYQLNLKYFRIDRVLTVVFLAWVLGSIAGLALASAVSWNTLWSNKGRTLSAIVASLTAVYVVYIAQYDSDPSWPGTTSLFTALFATALGAAYAATHVAGTAQLKSGEDQTSHAAGAGTTDGTPGSTTTVI
jgi:hypothetical protein